MLLRLALVVSLALLVAACGGDGSEPAPPSSAPTTDGAAVRTQQPGVVTAAEGATAAPSVTPGEPVTPDANQPAVRAAREDLAGRFDRPVEDVGLVSVTKHVWPDTCLGVTLTNEEEPAVCAQVLTPGYEIKLRLSESVYTFRTDETGGIVRFSDLEFSAED